MQKLTNSLAFSGKIPDLLISLPVLTWIKNFLFFISSLCLLNSFANFSLSNVWKTSKIWSASLTLLLWSGPVKWSSISLNFSFILKNLAIASWTLFSPNIFIPSEAAFSTTSNGWFLEIAIIFVDLLCFFIKSWTSLYLFMLKGIILKI